MIENFDRIIQNSPLIVKGTFKKPNEINMKTLLFLSLTILFLGVSPGQDYEKEYLQFENMLNREVAYSMHVQYSRDVTERNKISWKKVVKPLLRGFTATNRLMRYAFFYEEDCVLVVMKGNYFTWRDILEMFPEYTATRIWNDDAYKDDHSIFHLKRK